MSPPPAKRARTNNNGGRKKILVQTGQRGFLATCNYQENGCIRECFNILAHYANFVYGANCEVPHADDIDDLQDEDISDELQREINAAQQECYKPKKARFLALDTGAQNTVFIRTTLQDPVQLGYFIVRDIWNTKSQRTRALIRLIPIEVVCTATNIQTIVNAVGPTFDKYFVTKPCSYSIVVNRRLNNSIERDVIIRELASLVRNKNSENTVDLRNPSKTIVVEIIKGTCMIGVLPSYFKYKKYNLIECARTENGQLVEFFNVSSPAIMQFAAEEAEDVEEESPESPVEHDVDEVLEEPMEGPIDENTNDENMEEIADFAGEEPQKSLTDSPDSPQDEDKKVAVPMEVAETVELVEPVKEADPDKAEETMAETVVVAEPEEVTTGIVESTTTELPAEDLEKEAVEQEIEKEEKEQEQAATTIVSQSTEEKIPEKFDNKLTLAKNFDDEPKSSETANDNNGEEPKEEKKKEEEKKDENALESKISVEIDDVVKIVTENYNEDDEKKKKAETIKPNDDNKDDNEVIVDKKDDNVNDGEQVKGDIETAKN